MRSLAVAAWLVLALAVSEACGGVASPWSGGCVFYHGLCRTAWLGDCSGCGRCHAHSAHVIASLGSVRVEVGCSWCCCCCWCACEPWLLVACWACGCVSLSDAAASLVACGVSVVSAGAAELRACGSCVSSASVGEGCCCHPQFQWFCHHWFQPPFQLELHCWSSLW